MENFIFYYCFLCGNIVTRDIDSNDQPICCREPMSKMTIMRDGADKDEHLPVIAVNGNDVTVSVGNTLHPMSKSHYIKRIYLLTSQGMKRSLLEYDEKPVKTFTIDEADKVIGAYSYCDSHGLWYAEMK